MKPISLDMTVTTIAAELPGAAELFRKSLINFCCGGDISLERAAERAGISSNLLLADLEALRLAAGQEAPEETGELIDHLVSRYHDTHRQELNFLISLAGKVERVHGDHPASPSGLAQALKALGGDLEAHMANEENIVFPLMRGAQNRTLSQPIVQMRHEHDHAARLLLDVEHAAHGMVLPEGACGSWTALYTGLRKFSSDLIMHMHLENEVLFPRFGQMSSAL